MLPRLKRPLCPCSARAPVFAHKEAQQLGCILPLRLRKLLPGSLESLRHRLRLRRLQQCLQRERTGEELSLSNHQAIPLQHHLGKLPRCRTQLPQRRLCIARVEEKELLHPLPRGCPQQKVVAEQLCSMLCPGVALRRGAGFQLHNAQGHPLWR
jgi:hypothetical protein